MAVNEYTVLMKYKDSAGDTNLLYPITKQENVTTSGTGAAYTATVASIIELQNGVSFVMIPHVVSTTISPTLNVNGLGAKYIRRRVSNSTVTTATGASVDWLAASKPIRVMYDGTFWIADTIKTNATDLMGIVPIDNGGTGAETAAEALESLGVNAAIGKASWPHNWLDNSDFTNPINQRNFSIGGEGSYVVDRWLTGATTNAQLSNAIMLDGTATAASYIRQRIPILPDGDYTAAVWRDNYKLWVSRRIQITDGIISSVSATTDNGNVNVTRHSNSGYDDFRITINAGYPVALTYAALYSGHYEHDEIPEYRPKDYVVEWAACKRYFYKIPSLQRFRDVGIGTTTIDFWIPIPDMRIVPTVSNGFVVRTLAGSQQSGFTFTTLASANTCGLVIRATSTSSHGLSSAQLLASSSVELNAEF